MFKKNSLLLSYGEKRAEIDLRDIEETNELWTGGKRSGNEESGRKAKHKNELQKENKKKELTFMRRMILFRIVNSAEGHKVAVRKDK